MELTGKAFKAIDALFPYVAAKYDGYNIDRKIFSNIFTAEYIAKQEDTGEERTARLFMKTDGRAIFLLFTDLLPEYKDGGLPIKFSSWQAVNISALLQYAEKKWDLAKTPGTTDGIPLSAEDWQKEYWGSQKVPQRLSFLAASVFEPSSEVLRPTNVFNIDQWSTVFKAIKACGLPKPGAVTPYPKMYLTLRNGTAFSNAVALGGRLKCGAKYVAAVAL